MHQVRLAKGVEQDLKRIPVFQRNRILDAIETQLTNTPETPTKNRKLLENLITPLEAMPPIWELRVGEYRVFYDVSEEEAVVYTSHPAKAARQEDGGHFVKTVTARDLQKRVKECVDAAQNDRVVVTRRGKPAAVLVGVEGSDWEDVVLQSSPNFWRLIEERRRQPTISLHDLKARLKKRKR